MARIQGTKRYWEDKGKIDLRKNKALTPVQSGFPITAITLDLTKSCNLSCHYCNPAGTPILMADLTYKPIEEVKTGDKVIGFIIPEEKDKHTYFTIATIEGTAVRESNIVKVKTTNGDFRCTPDHKWFNGRSYIPARIGMDIKYVSDPIYFKETDDYKLGYIHGMMAGDGAFSEGKHIYKDGPQKGNTNIYHHFRLALNDIEAIDRTERYINELNLGIIHRFQYTEKMTGLRSGSRDLFNKAQGFPSDDSSDEYIKGWAAGIFDAEGSYDGSNLRIAQLEGEVLDSIVYSFTRLNFDIKLEDYRDVKAVRINNGFQSVVKFFAMCNPAISRKRERVLVGKSVYGNSVVTDIIPDGYEKVYSLQTSTGNYVAHGHTSKNCFTNLSKGKYCTSDLTEEMGKKVIDWLMDKGTRGNSKRVDITFWGGEPLLKWDMMQTLVLYAEEKAKENDISVSFNGTTNVTLLTPEKFDFLEKHNLYFLLSVDGRQEHHDMHRVFKDGTGSWSLVDKNINAILERWPHYNVRASYSTETIETFLDDIKYLYNKGFRTIAYSPVSEGDWTEEKVKTLHKVWRDITDWYIECYNNGDPVKLKFLDDACRREVMPDGNHAPCGAGRGYVGVTTDGSFYSCVKPETLVHTEGGMERIIDIKEGTKVLTHTGQYQKVTKLWTKPYNGDMIKITPYQLNIPTEFTPNHALYAMKGKECNWWHDRCKPDCTRNNSVCPYKHYNSYETEWIDAGELTDKDFLVYPIDRTINNIPKFNIEKTASWAKDISSFHVNRDIMYMLGWYIAEGSATYGSIRFSLCNDEIGIAEKLKTIIKENFGLDGTITIEEQSHKCTLIVCSTALSDWFINQIGNGSFNKKIPNWIMTADPDLQLPLIQGMFYGDGGNDRGKSAFYSTTSVDLANQMKTLLLRQNIVPGMKEYFPSRHKDGIDRKKEYRIFVWNVDDCNKLFSNHWVFNEKSSRKSRKLGWIENDYLYLAIRKIEVTKYEGIVYNLEVENDNSYALESVCAHNCHRFNKFNDERPWWEKYYCLGHIDYGILSQEFRENFVNWDTKDSMQESCKDCPAFETHCTGGCWASNWDVCDDLSGLPIASCESTLSNMDEGKYIKENYPEIFDKIVPKRRTNKGVNKIPEVQGCQCYNINDILWGRIVKNNNDEASCLCNMSTYGDNPKQIDKCTCYNIEDNYMTFYDKREAQCGRFTKDQDPVNIAIEYLKKANLDIEKLSENQKEQIDQFASLLEINKELENLRKD